MQKVLQNPVSNVQAIVIYLWCHDIVDLLSGGMQHVSSTYAAYS